MNNSQSVPSSAANQDEVQPSSARRNDTVPQVFLVLSLIIAVVASIVMIAIDSQLWTRIAAVAALWAAIMGAIAVIILRRSIARERELAAEREQRFQVELDRELASHREQELILEQNYYDQLEEQESEVLAELKAELQAMRHHLQAMMGQELDFEPRALRAEAERIRELENNVSAADKKTTKAPQPSQSQPAQQPTEKKSSQQVKEESPARAQKSASQPQRSDVVDTGSHPPLTTATFAAMPWVPTQQSKHSEGTAAERTNQTKHESDNPASQSKKQQAKPKNHPTADSGVGPAETVSFFSLPMDTDNPLSDNYYTNEFPAQNPSSTTTGSIPAGSTTPAPSSQSPSQRTQSASTSPAAEKSPWKRVQPWNPDEHRLPGSDDKSQASVSAPAAEPQTKDAPSGRRSAGRHETPAEDNGSGRRRADDGSQVTVASLLEQLRKNSSDNK